jgi:glycosyltransferase involved in cell wall biosynthesis
MTAARALRRYRGDVSLRVVARPAFKNAERQPYNAMLYGALRELGVEVVEHSARAMLPRCDVVHVHWPEAMLETSSRARAAFTARRQLALIDWARWRKAKLVWTVHELVPHDLVFPELERRFFAALRRRVDAWIAPSATGAERVRGGYPELARLPSAIVPLGHTRAARVLPSRDAARRALGIAPQSRVLLHFGQARPYKNLPHLIRVVRALPDPDLLLWICGRLGKRVPVGGELREAAGGDPRVRLELRHLSDEELSLRIRAADLLVFPFREVLHSSSALHALSHARPILVSSRGALPELAGQVGKEWVRVFEGDLVGAALVDALTWACRGERSDEPELDAFAWPRIARRTLDFYRSLQRGPACPEASPPSPPATPTATSNTGGA